MSLIDSFKEPCILLNEIKKPDGESGFITTWEDAVEIECAIVNNTSTLAQIAQQQGVTSTYTVTTSKNVVLKYPDVIRRVSDGQIFRITSNGNDVLSPNTSSLDISQATAEKWSLPT